MKCEICKKTIATTFLKKILGTYIKKGKKKHLICPECQSKLSKEEILNKL
ncbi:MAG: hypothetical protein KAT43_02050 [Nanoarchaeota archaeon]|nr:hypothetical protein [Nanoarchaeota archaeon]